MQPTTASVLCVIAGTVLVSVGANPAAALTQCGEASWYDHAGTKSASGGVVDPTTLTAAHRSLPFGSEVHVENLNNGRTVRVEIDDRGPFIKGRIIDLSVAAAEKLGFKDNGLTRVRISPAEKAATRQQVACK